MRILKKKRELTPAEQDLVDKNRFSDDMAALAKRCTEIANDYVAKNDFDKESAMISFFMLRKMKVPVSNSFAGILFFLGHNKEKFSSQELFEIYLSFYSPTLYLKGKSVEYASIPMESYARELFVNVGRDRTKFLTLLRSYNYSREVVLEGFSDDYTISLNGGSTSHLISNCTKLHTLCKDYLSIDAGFENGLNISAVDYDEIRITKPDDLRLYKFISNTLAKEEW